MLLVAVPLLVWVNIPVTKAPLTLIVPELLAVAFPVSLEVDMPMTLAPLALRVPLFVAVALPPVALVSIASLPGAAVNVPVLVQERSPDT